MRTTEQIVKDIQEILKTEAALKQKREGLLAELQKIIEDTSVAYAEYK